MSLSPDGKQILAPSVGWPFSLNIVNCPGRDAGAGKSCDDRQRAVNPVGQQEGCQGAGTHTGVAHTPDGRLLYDATGDSGAVDILATRDWWRIARIPLGKDSFAASLET